MIAHLGHHDRCRGVVLKKKYRYIENNIVMATVEWSLDNNEKKGFRPFRKPTSALIISSVLWV